MEQMCETAILPEEGVAVYKKSQCQAARLGDEYCYWLCLINRSAQTLEQVTVTDDLCSGLDLVEGSLWLDGHAIAGDLSLGVCLPELASGDFVILSYAVCVSGEPETPYFENTAWVDYQSAEASGRAVSNTVQVLWDSCALQMGYFVQQTTASCGERINCTGYVTNSGTCLLEETYLSLRLPAGVCLLPETLTFDEPVTVGSDLQRLFLGRLAPQQTIRFSFQLLVETKETRRARGQAFAFGQCGGGENACSEIFSQDFYWNPSC